MIGIIRKYFDDENIFLTADHGHMNGNKGKYGYGFDLHNSSIRIPLITPKINGKNVIEFNTCNTQLGEILLDRTVEKQEFLLSETAYYMQPHRKMAVICGKYKYIYEKATDKEYLYDMEWDPSECHNLLATEIYDVDRKTYYSANQRFFYPYWDEAIKIAPILREKKNSIWVNAPRMVELKERYVFRMKMFYQKMSYLLKK